ncbi:hypothetical protein IPdc08_00116 [archaeon]|nr:hypothetical protein IPdc08_00116 [archaeon]
MGDEQTKHRAILWFLGSAFFPIIMALYAVYAAKRWKNTVKNYVKLIHVLFYLAVLAVLYFLYVDIARVVAWIVIVRAWYKLPKEQRRKW